MGFDASITGSVASYVGSLSSNLADLSLTEWNFLVASVRSPGPILHHAYFSGIIYVY